MSLWRLGKLEEQKPGDEPDDVESTGDEEGRAPTHGGGDDGDKQGGDDGPDIGAAVEDAGGQGTFAAGEPEGDGLDGGGEVGRFADAEHETRHAELQGCAGEGVAHRGQAPDDDREGVTDFDAEPIDDASGDRHH